MTTYVLSPAIRFGIAGTVSSTVTFYNAGTTTSVSTWSDNGVTPNASSVIMDANGTAQVFIEATKAYRAIYRNSAGSTVFDVDNIVVADPTGAVGTTGTSITLTGTITAEDGVFNDDVTIGDDLTVGGSVTITDYLIANGITLTSLPPGFRNGSISAAVVSGGVEIKYMTQDGNVPSAVSTVTMTRRNQTITTGTTHNVNQTGSVSTTIPSGASLGCGVSEAVRVHVGAVRNAGSAQELCAWTAAVSSSPSVKGFNPSELVTTSSWSATADLAQTVYSTTTRTSQPLVYLGYLELTSTSTAGVWSSVDKIVNWEPDVLLPGQIAQIQATQTGEVATGTTLMVSDDSPPLITEGDQYMSQAITAKSSLNKFIVESHILGTHSVATASIIMALYQDATSASLSAAAETSDTGGTAMSPSIRHVMIPGTASATTLRIRAGGNTAGTMTFNGAAGARSFGGVCNSYLSVTEIHV